MSGALLAGSAVFGIAQQALQSSGIMPAMFGVRRSIGTIIPDVTIEESHSDRLTVTQHPIADGSPVSDHAYKLPATITMRIGFSNAGAINNAIGAGVAGFASGGISGALGAAGSNLMSSFTEERVKTVYDNLLKLQFDRDAWDKGKTALNPFKLVTGKKTYDKVVITEISIRTDRTTEYSLMVEVHMQEVFIVTTENTTQPAQADQSQAPKTADTKDQPDKQATTPKENSDSRMKQDFGVVLT